MSPGDEHVELRPGLNRVELKTKSATHDCWLAFTAPTGMKDGEEVYIRRDALLAWLRGRADSPVAEIVERFLEEHSLGGDDA